MNGRLAGVVALSACLLACNHGVCAADAYHYRQPPTLSDGWITGSLDDVKVDRFRVERMTEAIRREPGGNIHAVLIERDGRLVYEEYSAGDDERRYNQFSNDPTRPLLVKYIIPSIHAPHGGRCPEP